MPEQSAVNSGFMKLHPAMQAKVNRALLRSSIRLDAPEELFRQKAESRLLGMRVNRYSWWVHGRELADYILPRRYKWLITPNQLQRGSPINQHILDSTGTLAARNLAAGMMMGCSDPTKRWFRYKINNIDSTQTSPVSLWLAQVERLINLILLQSNFYDSLAIFYFDLVVFGTAVMLIYEDFENVIRCFNPCFGEYYVDQDGYYRPNVFAREFTNTVDQAASRFGVENLSPNSARLWTEGGTSLTRELVVAHLVEPNEDGRKYGVPEIFPYRECYWEWGGSASPQGGGSFARGLLSKRGFHENPAIVCRWDLVSNDAYGRSPGMDALPDIKQLQVETKRLSQGIDKMVNPPMVGDIQLKNQPASLLPGGVTYVNGMTVSGKAGFAPAYLVNPQVKEMMEQMADVRARIKETFYNNLFQVISQFETRSNVTLGEIDARRSEAMLMLGPVLERLNHEGFSEMHERVFGIASRGGILPPAPREIHGANLHTEFTSMIELAQNAAQGSSIERLFNIAGAVAGIDPAITDNIDFDYGFDSIAHLFNINPKMIRSPDALAMIRQKRDQAQQQQETAQQADTAQKIAQGAKTLAETPMTGGTALTRLTGQA